MLACQPRSDLTMSRSASINVMISADYPSEPLRSGCAQPLFRTARACGMSLIAAVLLIGIDLYIILCLTSAGTEV